MSERIDLGDMGDTLGDFGAVVQPCEAIPAGEVWTGPAGADPLRAFRPGTTAGGRAEAGWFMVGRVVGDGPTFVAEHQDQS